MVTAIGDNALQSLTGGGYGVAIGRQALQEQVILSF